MLKILSPACLSLSLALVSPAIGQGSVDTSARQAAELDRAIDYLQRRKAQDPTAADADVRACAFPGRDAGAVIDCMADREWGRDTQKRKPPFPSALIPASPTKSPNTEQPQPANGRFSSTISVSGGFLNIIEGNPHDRKSSISYNNNLIREFSDVYLSIHSLQFLEFGEEVVLIYYVNMGGSGTPNQYGIISVGQKGRIFEADLPVGTGKFEQIVTRDKIVFNLGLDSGKEVRAVYTGGRLDVTRTTAPKIGLKADDCDFLYNDVLSECSARDNSVCRYDDMPISMARQRPVNMLATDDPNFRRKDFEAACEQACRTKRKPAYASFRAAVCLPK